MERLNKFKIVIPSFNNQEWVEPNMASIIQQTYTNYEVLYIDDDSTDDTLYDVNKIIRTQKLEDKWKVITNSENQKRGYNVSPYNEHLLDFMDKDEDILVFVDGDDWLFDEHVLDNLNKFYNKHKVWMTYGGMYCYPSGELASPQNTVYLPWIHNNNLYRKDHWRASHLRTFKWHLYKQIKKKDIQYSKTGKYYFHAEDLATSFPCLEMCPENKIGVVDFPTYTFNETPSNRARGVERENEAGDDLEKEIREQTPYNVIAHPLDSKQYVTCKILGAGTQTLGLGNQLFCIATVLSLAAKNKVTPVFSFDKAQAPYQTNIFRNLNFSNEINTNNIYTEPHFHYKEIPYSPGLCVDGYFQSEKYFKEHKDEIRAAFKISDKDASFISNNFEHLFYNEKGNGVTTISLHIRRGDYTLPQYASHHPVQTIEYYDKAMKYFNEEYSYCERRFLVFSDDIDWAKANLKGDNIKFVTQNTIKGNDVMDTLDISKGGYPDYIDLYLMSKCHHHIIANSSFSWWGAWLDDSHLKKVIAPKNWFGPAYGDINDNDLVPESWIRM